MPRIRLLLICSALITVTLACSSTPPPAALPTEVPGPDFTATAHAAAVAAAVTTTLEAHNTQAALEATEAAQFTAVAEATEAVLAAQTATVARATAIFVNRQGTVTARAATSAANATTTAQPMAAVVEQLVTDGYLTQANGHFESLVDFRHAWAQINGYQWLPTGEEPADFVVRADVAWDSASTTANWFNSGCGFVFREAANAANDHYLVYLGLDGVVYLARQHFDEFFELASVGYGRL